VDRGGAKSRPKPPPTRGRIPQRKSRVWRDLTDNVPAGEYIA
jgi:hypothetical protein